MNATALPLLQPLCESLTTIARSADARALRAHLEGRGLPIVGGDTEPAELILRALGETPDPPRLAADLAPPLARVIAECTAELRTGVLTPPLRLLLHQALRFAADLPAHPALASSLRDLAASLEEAAPDFWYQAPLAPLVARALVYQQTDTQTEPLWLRLLESSGEGPWTPERRTVLLSAWRGLLHVPPDEEAALGRVIDMDRVEHGLLALEAGARSREGGPRLVRQALRTLTETFPRSPHFWQERLTPRLGLWPEELREAATRQWPNLPRLVAPSLSAELSPSLPQPLVVAGLTGVFGSQGLGIDLQRKPEEGLRGASRFQLIRAQAREALAELFQRRYDLWPNPPSDLEMIEPERIIQLWKIDFSEFGETRLQSEPTDFSMRGNYAGCMDPERNTIAVARHLRPEIRRFTLAHELGHYSLHRDLGVLFRDLPLLGAEMEDRHREPEEREADLFAAELLMPERFVRREFRRYFGVESFAGVRPSEDVAFHLSTTLGRQVTVADLEQRGRRQLSFLLAESSPWEADSDPRFLPTLSGLFRVSTVAMAIQLERLRLV